LDFSEQALSGGLDPMVVGRQVHDAVVKNRFWLFTDDAWDDPIMRRAEAITNRDQPTIGRPTPQ
jgi:hypothetical protein